MARKKKTDPEYVTAKIADNLIRISLRYDKSLNDLWHLNPSIRFINSPLKPGQKVRIS